MDVLENMGRRMVKVLENPVTIGLVTIIDLPFNAVSYILREKPYETTTFSELGDLIAPARVIYKNKDLKLIQFEEEIKKFSGIEKCIDRWRYIPAGDGFIHTSKKKIKRCNAEEAWEFLKENVTLKEKTDSDKENDKIYSSGHFYSTLRHINEDNFWLHVKNPKLYWPAFTEIDILGVRLG